jgi:uncharacterized protein (TIGR03083 family)
MTSEPSTTALLDALRASHDRLVAVVSGLTDGQAAGPSYDDDWSIGQVASHLGSGAEVFHLFLEAGLQGAPTPGVESMQPIWAVWDGKTPEVQVRDVVGADAGFLDRVAAMSADEQEKWRIDLFGTEQDLAGLLRMRLGEHALHTWDIAVMADPGLAVPEDAAAHVVDNLAMVAGRAGQPNDEPFSVEVRTTGPERALHLDVGPEGVALSPSLDDTGAATLTLPAEALIRLVYGRLDPDHTPDSVTPTGIDLDVLRRTFPGV